MEKKSSAGMIALGIICAWGGGLWAQPSKDFDLDAVAEVINKSLPMVVDVDTKVEKVTAEKSLLIYHTILVNYKGSELEYERISQAVNEMRLNACSNPDYLKFFKNGVSIRLNYYSRDNILIISTTMLPSLCSPGRGK